MSREERRVSQPSHQVRARREEELGTQNASVSTSAWRKLYIYITLDFSRTPHCLHPPIPTLCKWSWATQEARIIIKQDSSPNSHHTGECSKATEVPPLRSQVTTAICHVYCWGITLR